MAPAMARPWQHHGIGCASLHLGQPLRPGFPLLLLSSLEVGGVDANGKSWETMGSPCLGPVKVMIDMGSSMMILQVFQ